LSLEDYITADPEGTLGEDTLVGHGPALPYLLKLIAPMRPLSLQVHPSKAQAQAGFDTEEEAGIPLDSPDRNYRDRNAKPELVYAITSFEALVGFRAPRRIAEVMRGLRTPLSDRLRRMVLREGVRAAFTYLISPETCPSGDRVASLVEACAERDPEKSPSRRADAAVVSLAAHYPGDASVLTPLLMNPVSLRPGEALYIPDGTVHAYRSGVGVEIMASSDNVLRAGLTEKHIDVPELLRVVRADAAPPMRIAPERVSASTSVYYAPVEDFELSVVQLSDANAWDRQRSEGPRTVVCMEGAVQVYAGGGALQLNKGQAVFIGANEGEASLRGFGKVVIAAVP
ncbi:MAG: mannose-6-phosphate isomerase, class I, partial [Ancrocorticia sp.]|uniref:mannose-6-phosphate isomerase, class I n=1 Tax=Ancrocorticia sp. TaxID=2593684 RepID=UPI003F900A9C